MNNNKSPINTCIKHIMKIIQIFCNKKCDKSEFECRGVVIQQRNGLFSSDMCCMLVICMDY